jgi:hypothetical protein
LLKFCAMELAASLHPPLAMGTLEPGVQPIAGTSRIPNLRAPNVYKACIHEVCVCDAYILFMKTIFMHVTSVMFFLHTYLLFNKIEL